MVMKTAADPDVGAIPDQQLVERVRKGDEAAFELIMRRHNRRLYHIARGIIRNEAEAEDVVQEAYTRAFERLGDYHANGLFSAWLARITINEALRRLRRDNPRRVISLDDPELKEEETLMSELTFNGPNPEQTIAREDFRRILEASIDALPELYRLVFVLRGVEEMSAAETAACLEIDPATVKTRYHRARRMLQQHLAGMVDANAAEVFPFAGKRCDRIVEGVLKRIRTDAR